MTTEISSNQLLATTAFWTAGVRARESNRNDRLFFDPLAAVLAGDEGAAWLADRSEDSTIPIVLRTRYFDDFLQRVTLEHKIGQVVIMAAGLDTRAFRLNWPEELTVFELDQPDVLKYKDKVLQSMDIHPACKREVIYADLTGSWKEALIGRGFNPQTPSCWLLEGFLFYLPGETIKEILEGVIAISAPGSWLGFDIINSAVLNSPYTKPWVDMQAQSGAPWIGTMDDPESFLAARGWKTNLTQSGQLDANYGRWVLPIIPTKMPNFPHNWLVTAYK